MPAPGQAIVPRQTAFTNEPVCPACDTRAFRADCTQTADGDTWTTPGAKWRFDISYNLLRLECGVCGFAWYMEPNDPERAGARPIARVIAELEDTNQRLRDLVRHQRGQLFDAGLLTDEEYAALCSDHGAVARLRGYDAMRARLAELEATAVGEDTP